ncbi:heavy metal-binding domain-containing protein, partial [Bacteroides fragilis]
MKKISDILRKKQVLYPLIALAGFVLGWLLFSPSSSPESAGETHAEAHNHDMHGTSHDLVQDESGVWTCSMHPQIRQDKPGKCPICGMD